MVTFPSVKFIKPKIDFIIVVFPAPFGPINPTTSPLSTENEILSIITSLFT